MATIDLYDLNPFGAELFQDDENYLNDLNEQEVDRVWSVSEIALSFPCFENINIQTQVVRTVMSKENNSRTL